MSGSGQSNNNCCDPCDSVKSTESVASQNQNLVDSLFGMFTKTVTNGVAVWSGLCDPNAEIPSFPRNEGEGFICYIIRILPFLGVVYAGEWDAGEDYSAREIVTVLPDKLYIALQDAPAGTDPALNPSFWSLYLQAPTGPQGPAGSPGSGSAVNYALLVTAVDVNPGDTDAIIVCQPSSVRSVNLPSIATTLSAKWFVIHTNGAFDVVINPNGADTINGAASYTLPAGIKQAIKIVALPNPDNDWIII